VVVARLGARQDQAHAVDALRHALAVTFPNVELKSENGFYRDNVDERLRRMAAKALS
jgi:hypothetical protein